MAYSESFIRDVLTADQPDLLLPEFAARAMSSLAKAGATLSQVQLETMTAYIDAPGKMDEAGLTVGDPIRVAIESSAGVTMTAQSSIQASLAKIADSTAKVVNRA